MKLTHVAAIAALLFASHAQAQTISVEDFAKRAEAWEVSLSPSGNHVAMAVPTPDGK